MGRKGEEKQEQTVHDDKLNTGTVAKSKCAGHVFVDVSIKLTRLPLGRFFFPSTIKRAMYYLSHNLYLCFALLRFLTAGYELAGG